MLSRPWRSMWALALILLTSLQVQLALGEDLIESRSLIECMEGSKFTASLFNVKFTAADRKLHFDIVGESGIKGNVEATLEVYAYGLKALTKTFKPCDMELAGLCPMNEGIIDLESNLEIEPEVMKQIPSIAFTIPDLDGKVRIWIKKLEDKQPIACLEARLYNGKTVDQKAVGWTTAVISGMGLLASGVTSGFGHSTTAAHVAANAISLFGFFQAQAMCGMTAVPLPPIVQAWTQNFDWSMGIIRIRSMQNALHWYVQSTGGEPSNLLGNVHRLSISLQRRGLEYLDSQFDSPLARRGLQYLARRSNNDNTLGLEQTQITLKGIERVAYKGNVEQTNFFLTGLSFFFIFLLLICLGIAAFKWGSELAIKMKWIRGSKFQEFRNGYLTILKGIMYRVVLIGFPQMATLCLWEFTQRDSNGALALAIFFFFTMAGILGWGCYKVMMLAKKSVSLHQIPGYILYSDPNALNKWGFLYVSYKAECYFYVVPFLAYILVKAMFIAFSQGNGTIQVIGLLVVEFAFLVAAFKIKPWMDKRVNVFNLSICSLNFFNAVFLLFFTGAFKLPGIVGGVMGVVWFVVNAAFASVLLVLVLASSIYAVTAKNPETRYQPMRDDRNSFIKSSTNVGGSTELDALGASARGDFKEGGRRPIDDDDAAFDHPAIAKQQYDAQGVPLPPSTAGSHAHSAYEQDNQAFYPAQSRYQDDGYSQHSGYSNQQQQQQYQNPVSTNNLPLLDPSGARTPSRQGNRSPANGGGGGYSAYQAYGGGGGQQGNQGYAAYGGGNSQHPRQSRANDDYSWHPGNNSNQYQQY